MALDAWGRFKWGVRRWWEGGPQSQQQFLDQPGWLRPVEARNQKYLIEILGATGGTFTLTIVGTGTTAAIAYNATPAQVRDAIAAVTGGGSVTVSGRPGRYAVEFIGGLAAQAVTMTMDGSGLTGVVTSRIIEVLRGREGQGSIDPLPVTPGGTPEDFELTASTTNFYTLEIHDEEGELLKGHADPDNAAFWSNWTQPKMRLEIDAASVFSFRIPGTDATTIAQLVQPNKIWVRDRWGMLIEIFHIRRTHKIREGDAIFFAVDTQSRLAQLGKEPASEVTFDEILVKDAVAALFANQVQTPPIAVGVIDPIIGEQEITIEFQRGYVLGALRRIQDALPLARAGHFFVDSGGTFQWLEKITGPLNEQIVIGRGLKGINAVTDWDELVTRVYLYGAGEDPRTQLRLTDAGESNDYVENAAGVAAYGVRPLVREAKGIESASALLSMANRIVEEFGGSPFVEVSVDVIDLAKSINFDGWEDLIVGAEYQVLDPAQSIDTTVTLRVLEPNMENPLKTTVDLSNRPKRLSDFLARLFETQASTRVNVNEGTGDRLPNISRIYDGTESIDRLTLRDGDLLAENSPVELSVRDSSFGDAGGQWVQLVPGYLAADEASLPTDGVQSLALGRAEDTGDLYRRNDANDGWEKVGLAESDIEGIIDEAYILDIVWRTATTEGGLAAPGDERVLGRVTAGADQGRVYSRNDADDDWLPIARYHAP